MQSGASRHLFERAEAGEIDLVMTPVIVAECCYVLRGPVYRLDRIEISDRMAQLMMLEGVITEEKSAVFEALSSLRDRSVDFADAFLAAKGRGSKCKVATFDRDFHGLNVGVFVPE